MPDKKPEHPETTPAPSDAPAQGDVLTNAFRRLDNRFRGKPNDASLIGEDLPDDEEDDADPDAEDGDEKDDDWPEPKGTKLW